MQIFFLLLLRILRAAMGDILSSLNIHIFILCARNWFVFAFISIWHLATGTISFFSLAARIHRAKGILHLLETYIFLLEFCASTSLLSGSIAVKNTSASEKSKVEKYINDSNLLLKFSPLENLQKCFQAGQI